ncbi:MAG: GyrI-like domain-containing protein [Christensenellaceae bacterium]|jgi:hypothetical protein|nr:GyrI-like domain-containing protein [Christensenellaceae bacterium]
MEFLRREKAAFEVIGKLGKTSEGEGFVQRLWAEASAHYAQVSALAKLDEQGRPLGFWGAMSDLGGNFLPWEDGFSKGLYLAGVEALERAEAPEGWVKWTIPGFEYACCKVEGDPRAALGEALAFLDESGLSLAGAVQDYLSPSEEGQPYLYLPVRRL